MYKELFDEISKIDGKIKLLTYENNGNGFVALEVNGEQIMRRDFKERGLPERLRKGIDFEVKILIEMMVLECIYNKKEKVCL